VEILGRKENMIISKKLKEIMDRECQDNSCYFRVKRYPAMRTNGGCTCIEKFTRKDWVKIFSYIYRLEKEIKELKNDVE